MRIRVEGLDELIDGLTRDINLLRRCASHRALKDALREPVSAEHQRVFETKGRVLGEDWGTYSRDYDPPKLEGVRYFLRETGAMSGALIWYSHRVMSTQGAAVVFTVRVDYAEHVYENYGRFLSDREAFADDVSRVTEEWFVQESRLPWEVRGQ